MSILDIYGATAKLTARNTASRSFLLQFVYEYLNVVLDGESVELLEYWHLVQQPKYKDMWSKSFINKIERLASGISGRVKATTTVFFIHKNEVPQDHFKDVTHGRIVCNYRDQKVKNHQTR